MVIVLMLIMVCVAFGYVMLTRKPRKKPDVENQTTKRCPYPGCYWWITFKDLNDEVRRLYREHLETHKKAPQINFEDIVDYPNLKNKLSLDENQITEFEKHVSLDWMAVLSTSIIL
jgi:hypothetical protein